MGIRTPISVFKRTRCRPQVSLRVLLAAISGVTLLGSAPAYSAPKKFRVVLDPGHGGGDQGTIYSNRGVKVLEKNVTLKLALDAARALREAGVDAILTREDDRELTLGERTALANRVKADIFLSIHLNSPPPMLKSISRARAAMGADGVETFILNNATDESSRRLARLENSVLGGSEAQDGAAGQTEVALILKDLRLDANLGESKRLACLVQGHLVHDRGPGSDRGVKQALFHVLLGADMPSALLEVGFLSSPKDRSIVLSPSGRARIAKAMTAAVLEFRDGRALSRCKVR